MQLVVCISNNESFISDIPKYSFVSWIFMQMFRPVGIWQPNAGI